MLLAFCFGRRRRPITLLRLPPRPLPRRLPAFWAAIALARRHRTKTPLTAFQQTGARPRPAGRAFPSAVLLHWGEMSRILNRAHGSLVPGKLMPRRGRLSSPGRSSSGSLRTQDFIAPTRVVALGFPLRPLIRALGQGWEFCQGRAQRARRVALDRGANPVLADGQEGEAKSLCRAAVRFIDQTTSGYCAPVPPSTIRGLPLIGARKWYPNGPPLTHRCPPPRRI